jgi:V/A-type H+-transporting ATPase subunit I
MFRPSPMDRVELLVLKSDLPEVSRALARGRILHLQSLDLENLPVSPPVEAYPGIERLKVFAATLDTIFKDLGVEGEVGKGPLTIEDFSLWEAWAAELLERVRRILDRKEEISRRLEGLVQLETFLTPLAGLEGDFSELASLHHTRLLTGVLPAASEKRLEAKRLPAMVFPLRRTERETTVAILTSRGHSAAIERILNGLDFQPRTLSGRLSGSFDINLQRVRRAQSRFSAYLAILEGRLAGLREEHREHLASRGHAVAVELFLREAQGAFGFTRRVVMLGGWLPRSRATELKNLLSEVCPDRFFLRRSAARGDETPVQLANPKLLRPFQKLLNLYGTPLYGEVEPTPLLGFGFLVLFGMMFGDLGQGVLLMGAGLCIKRFTRFAEEGLLLTEIGVAAAVFGILFGSVFGLENIIPALWFSPFHDIPYLMASAIALGIVLIFSGLLLRIRNLLGHANLPDILTDRFGIAGAVFYGGSVASTLLVYLDRAPVAILLWLLAPLVCVLFHPLIVASPEGERNLFFLLAEGVIEAMETVLGYLVNTFSFLRVGAFGLAHIGLFYAVFALADLVRDLPLGPLWVALVYFSGNLVILLLEGLVVSIQAVRLQFYEFFSKFFRGGGIPYRPLALESAAERRK